MSHVHHVVPLSRATLAVRPWLVLVSVAMLAPACAIEPGEGEHAPGTSSEEPAASAVREVFELDTDALRAVADATAALVWEPNAALTWDGTAYHLDSPSVGDWFAPMCATEPIARQPSAAFCSAVAVDAHLVITAGQCVADDLDCERTAVVFGYDMRDDERPAARLEGGDVYHCAGVVARGDGDAGDWALLRLDRPLEGHDPLPLRRRGAAELDPDVARLVTAGHPLGAPLKAVDATASRPGAGQDWLDIRLPGLGADPGAPVVSLDAQGRLHYVEGLVVADETDLVYRDGCYSVSDCDGDAACAAWRPIARTASFSTSVPESCGQPVCETAVRVVTWNVQTIGDPGSPEYNAVLDVLGRIGADVVGINEVNGSGELANFDSLALDAGYAFTVVPDSNPLGGLRNGFLSQFPFVGTPEIHTSAELSGDPDANDITRLIIEIVVDVPDTSEDLSLVVEHWKSGTGDANEFRRALESYRIAQSIADLDTFGSAFVVMGDMNEELDSVPRTPDPFTSVPSGLPSSFVLGADLAALLAGPGLRNDPFYYLMRDDGIDGEVLYALQLDGSDATRPTSGRRLDYLTMSHELIDRGALGEVYDSSDEGLPGGLPKVGSPLSPGTCTVASDHFPVFADILISSTSTCTVDGDCADGVFCNGAEACVGGACMPGTPPTCDDGVACTVDTCDGGTDACANTPDDGACDNGLFCDGAETCDALTGCLAGAPPSCDDGVSCTVDTCDGGTDACANTPDDSACDNGLVCDGAETCDAVAGCLGGTPVDCDDGDSCTIDSCDEALGCAHDPDPVCTGGPVCGDHVCEGGTETCFTCGSDCRCSGRNCSNGCCGDGVCDGSENSHNCAVDCP